MSKNELAYTFKMHFKSLNISDVRFCINNP